MKATSQGHNGPQRRCAQRCMTHGRRHAKEQMSIEEMCQKPPGPIEGDKPREKKAVEKPAQESFPFFSLSNNQSQLGLGFLGASEKPLLPPPPCVEVLSSELSSFVKYTVESVNLNEGLTLLKGRVNTRDVFALSNSDLVPGKYEGGLKLWEGSLDLVKTLRSEVQDGRLSLIGKRVLEVGCSGPILVEDALETPEKPSTEALSSDRGPLAGIGGIFGALDVVNVGSEIRSLELLEDMFKHNIRVASPTKAAKYSVGLSPSQEKSAFACLGGVEIGDQSQMPSSDVAILSGEVLDHWSL
ncbi:hypothetical protein HHK36_026229 [Tetracentron sinense]|uniref:Uncharacterized protein n=1 Tax=Tetracentron sinense TaxID=13715 RepID=A0A834YGG8_TETSI|nr:hypothetical protein HHK36_026229 [Tetracentron sinense]